MHKATSGKLVALSRPKRPMQLFVAHMVGRLTFNSQARCTMETESLLPKVQTLLLADHVWQGQGKTNILGIFDGMFFSQFPAKYGHELCLFGVLDNVRRDIDVEVRLQCFQHDKAKWAAPFKLKKAADPLKSNYLILRFAAGAIPIEHPGEYAFDVVVDGVTIGTSRFRVVHRNGA